MFQLSHLFYFFLRSRTAAFALLQAEALVKSNLLPHLKTWGGQNAHSDLGSGKKLSNSPNSS